MSQPPIFLLIFTASHKAKSAASLSLAASINTFILQASGMEASVYSILFMHSVSNHHLEGYGSVCQTTSEGRLCKDRVLYL